MREKSYVARLGVLALVLTPMITCLTGGTLTKFVTETEGEAGATAVVWEFKATGSNGAALSLIGMGRTAYKGETIDDNVTVPGTQGSFNIVLDGTGSDMGIDYIVTIDKSSEPDTSDLSDGLMFQVDGIDYSLGNEIEGKIEHTTGNDTMKGIITINWKRDYSSADTVEADKNDSKYVGKS